MAAVHSAAAISHQAVSETADSIYAGASSQQTRTSPAADLHTIPNVPRRTNRRLRREKIDGMIQAALLALALAQALDSPQWQVAAGGRMAFEVASVRLSKPGPFTPPNFPLDPGDAYAVTGGRFVAHFPLLVYISFAYKLWQTPEQRQAMLARLPKWVSTDSYDIQAKAAVGNPTKDQMRLMMQSLLAERFGLAVHFETQEAPLLALTLVKPGKPGPKIRPHAEGPACDAAVGPEVFPRVCDVYAWERHPDRSNQIGSRNTTMELLAASLPGPADIGRPMVDRTWIEGRVDFTLEWTQEAPSAAGPDAIPDLQGTSFIEALREQLGMKLEPTRGLVRVLVVDRVERPSEN